METIKIPANSEVLDYVTCKTQTTYFVKCGRIIPLNNLEVPPTRCPNCGRGI